MDQMSLDRLSTTKEYMFSCLFIKAMMFYTFSATCRTCEHGVRGDNGIWLCKNFAVKTKRPAPGLYISNCNGEFIDTNASHSVHDCCSSYEGSLNAESTVMDIMLDEYIKQEGKDMNEKEKSYCATLIENINLLFQESGVVSIPRILTPKEDKDKLALYEFIQERKIALSNFLNNSLSEIDAAKIETGRMV